MACLVIRDAMPGRDPGFFAAVEVIRRQVSAAKAYHASLIYQLFIRNTHMPSLIWTRHYYSSTEEEWV